MTFLSYSIRILFLSTLLFLGVLIWNNSSKLAKLKDKHYEIINVQNELLNPEEWKRRFKTVMVETVNELDISSKMLDKGLNSGLLNNIEIPDDFIQDIISVPNIESSLQTYLDVNKTKAGRAERILYKAIEKKITPISEIIRNLGLKVVTEFLTDPNNPVSKDLKIKIREYVLENKDQIENTIKDFVYEEVDKFVVFNDATNSLNGLSVDPYFDTKLSLLKKKEDRYLWIIFGLVIGLFTFLFLFAKKKWQHYIPHFQVDLLLVCLVLLILGVFLPMVSIVANIEKINFQLMGAEINFENQNLVYRSKSIIQVFKILFNQGMSYLGAETGRGVRLMAVAIFVVLFSVVFPLLKLLGSAVIHFAKEKTQFPKLTFIVTKLGKWSMADVFVVSVLISLLGINGMIDDQLGILGEQTITNTASTLDAGFYLFLAYTISSIAMTSYLKTDVKV